MSKKIGLVGCGRWGKLILRDLKSLNCEVEVFARGEQSIANATAYDADKIIADIKDFSSNLEGFVVASPTVTHVDCINKLLPHSCPIFVEKPLSDNLTEVQSLPQSAHELVFTMHKWRYHPAIEEMRRIAKNEEFGRVTGLRTKRNQWGNPHQDTNAIWILAPHDLSIATHILGEVPTAINSIAENFGNRHVGVTAQLITQKSKIPVTVEVSELAFESKRETLLCCENAAVFLSDKDYGCLTIKPWPESFNDQRVIETRRVAETMPLLAELRTFVEFLSGGPPPFTCLKDELKIIEALTQMQKLSGIKIR